MPRQKNTKELILKATTELLAESGLSSTSTRAIARRVEVSENTLYRHFKDKEDLIHCVFLKLINDITEHIKADDNENEPASDRLKLFVSSVCSWAEDRPQSMTVLLDLNAGKLKQLKGIQDPFDLLHTIILAGMHSKEFRQGDAQWQSISATGLMLRPMQMKDQEYLDFSWSELKEKIFENVLLFLK